MSLKELFAPRDMTEGDPWRRITEFAFPMLLGNIAQQLYNTADSIIVGKYVGDLALAAVGSAMPILNLLLDSPCPMRLRVCCCSPTRMCRSAL